MKSKHLILLLHSSTPHPPRIVCVELERDRGRETGEGEEGGVLGLRTQVCLRDRNMHILKLISLYCCSSWLLLLKATSRPPVLVILSPSVKLIPSQKLTHYLINIINTEWNVNIQLIKSTKSPAKCSYFMYRYNCALY